MANAPVARQLGDDYQARLFWFHACRLFLPYEDVAVVGFEVDEPLGFDDVMVKFSAPQPDGRGSLVTRDYFQSKYHVNQDGCITCLNLIEPAYIGTTSSSLLQRLHNARSAVLVGEESCRYFLVTPWSIRPGDALAKLRDNATEGLRIDRLASGSTIKSEMGAVRAQLRDHLQLASDDELFELLKAFRITIGLSFDELRDRINDRLALAGFRPISRSHIAFPYDDLIRKAFYAGMREFDAESLKDLAKREDLWIGPPGSDPDRPKVIAVRSFTKWTQQIADSADAFLDLVPYFAGRQILDDSYWSGHVWPRLREFFEAAIQEGGPEFDLHLDAHTTVAFAAGRVLSKAPANITPIQRSATNSIIRWSPRSDTRPTKEGLWDLSEQEIPGGNPAHVAVAISLTHDVFEDVQAYIEGSESSIGWLLHAVPSTGAGRTAVKDGAHAWILAESLAQRVRKERVRREPGSPLHIFCAAPNAFTFFLGQQGPTLGSCQLYEYEFDTSEIGAYRPSLLIARDTTDSSRTQEMKTT